MHSKTWIQLFIEALFVIAQNWKWPRCSSTDEQMNKFRYILTMEYNWTIKRNLHTKAWMIILSEKKPITKDHILYEAIYVICPEHANLQKQKID